MSRPAAFLSSGTGHGGMVVGGSSDVLVNGKKGAAVGHAVICPQHGPTCIVTGRSDVLINGKPMSRLHDKVKCSAPGALVDHGPPTVSAGGLDIYASGDLADVPQAQLVALAKALKSGDPVAIAKAWKDLPNKANLGKGTIKVVDPEHPNLWSEYEATGPGAGSQGDGGVKYDVKDGGIRIQGGGGPAKWGVKKTMVERYVGDDGKVHERRGSVSYGKSDGTSVDFEWSDKRKGLSIDSPWDWGGGFEDSPVGPVEMKPAPDIIVPPMSADVLVGG